MEVIDYVKGLSRICRSRFLGAGFTGMVLLIMGTWAGEVTAQTSRANALNSQGQKLLSAGKYAEAEQVFRKLVPASEKAYGRNHSNTGSSLANLSESLENQGKYRDAESFRLRSLAIKKRTLGLNHWEVASSMHQLGMIYFGQQRYREAIDMFEESRPRMKRRAPNNWLVGASIIRSMDAYTALGEWAEVDRLIEEGEEFYRGSTNTDKAWILLKKGDLNRQRGELKEAETAFKESYQLFKKGNYHYRNSCQALLGLGTVYSQTGRPREAENIFNEVIEHNKSIGNTGEAISTKFTLATLFGSEGRFKEAAELLETVLAEHSAIYNGFQPPQYLQSLGEWYWQLGNYKRAEEIFLQCLPMREKVLGVNHPQTAVSYRNVAHASVGLGKMEQAKKFALKGFEAERSHREKILKYFDERACLGFASGSDEIFQLAGKCLDGELAAICQISFKGAISEAMNHRRKAENSLRKSSSSRKLLESKQETGAKYFKCLLEKGSHHEETKKLAGNLEVIEKQIAKEVGETVSEGPAAITLDRVREAIGNNEVLVETFYYRHRLDSEEYKWEDRYSSSLIRNHGEIEYISHGSAERINHSVRLYREALLNHAPEPTAAARSGAFRSAEQVLYNSFLSPIEKSLNPGDTVIFSLDSQLHFIPPGMLRGPDGIPFCKKFNVRYVASGRDLIKESQESKSNTALVLGNPSFRHYGPLSTMAETGGETDPVLVSTFRNGISKDAGSVNLVPLPGTAREVERISEKLTARGYRIEFLKGIEASEEALKTGVNGACVIHLATHGFFLNEIEIPRSDQPLGAATGSTGIQLNEIQDPMYRSGLALSGAQCTFNLWESGRIPTPASDGVLTAAEANLLNLHGTDLVVLSACETAKGEALDGEGVMGLRRAFAGAGANSTIMTLWPVDDAATVEVMDVFYDKYLAGEHPAIALAEMQKELYQPFVEKYGEVEAIAQLAPFVCFSVGAIPTSQWSNSVSHAKKPQPKGQVTPRLNMPVTQRKKDEEKIEVPIIGGSGRRIIDWKEKTWTTIFGKEFTGTFVESLDDGTVKFLSLEEGVITMSISDLTQEGRTVIYGKTE